MKKSKGSVLGFDLFAFAYFPPDFKVMHRPRCNICKAGGLPCFRCLRFSFDTFYWCSGLNCRNRNRQMPHYESVNPLKLVNLCIRTTSFRQNVNSYMTPNSSAYELISCASHLAQHSQYVPSTSAGVQKRIYKDRQLAIFINCHGTIPPQVPINKHRHHNI